jgi:hypothetical protein
LRYFGVPNISEPSQKRRKKMTDGDSKMLNKTKVALAAALILGTASAALAGDQGEDRGGFVLPGSMVGVNPVLHPRWFPGYAAHHGSTGESYGYVVSPKQTHRVSHEQTQDRQ